MKIHFDKVEVELIGKYQGEKELKFEIPDSQKLEIGLVTQVGEDVEEVKVGDEIVFAAGSMNYATKNRRYLREREIIFIKDLEKKKYNMLADKVRAVEYNEAEKLSDMGIYLPETSSAYDLMKVEIRNINPNKNKLGLKVGQKALINPKYGLKTFEVDGSIFLHEHEIVYTL